MEGCPKSNVALRLKAHQMALFKKIKVLRLFGEGTSSVLGALWES